jgi:hypothetical protein
MRLLITLILCLSLGGCGFATRDMETGAVSGQLNGFPVELKWQRDGEGNVRVQLPPIATVAAGLIPPPWGEIASGLLALLAGSSAVAARMCSKRAEEHKADAEEGWKRALEGPKFPDVR